MYPPSLKHALRLITPRVFPSSVEKSFSTESVESRHSAWLTAAQVKIGLWLVSRSGHKIAAFRGAGN
jgi:hypothetical protein